jgi:hypothetical protein
MDAGKSVLNPLETNPINPSISTLETPSGSPCGIQQETHPFGSPGSFAMLQGNPHVSILPPSVSPSHIDRGCEGFRPVGALQAEPISEYDCDGVVLAANAFELPRLGSDSSSGLAGSGPTWPLRPLLPSGGCDDGETATGNADAPPFEDPFHDDWAHW